MKRIKLAWISATADCHSKLVTVNLWRNSEQTETMDRKVNIYKININILIIALKLKWKGRRSGVMRRVGNLLFLTQGLLASGSRTICPHSSPVERLLLFSRRQQQQQCSIMTEPVGGKVVKKSLADWSLAPSQLVARLPVDPDTENRIRRNVPGAVFSKGSKYVTNIFCHYCFLYWLRSKTYILQEVLRSSHALFIKLVIQICFVCS